MFKPYHIFMSKTNHRWSIIMQLSVIENFQNLFKTWPKKRIKWSFWTSRRSFDYQTIDNHKHVSNHISGQGSSNKPLLVIWFREPSIHTIFIIYVSHRLMDRQTSKSELDYTFNYRWKCLHCFKEMIHHAWRLWVLQNVEVSQHSRDLLQRTTFSYWNEYVYQDP